MVNKKIKQFCNSKRPLVCLTAYTKYMGETVDQHCDLVLVGDSVGMVLYGAENTREVTLDTMINHGKAVRKGVKKSILVIDMPKGTYEKSADIALKNAKKIFKKTKCDAVKLEGGVSISKVIKKLVKNNIPVMAHIGLMPQKVKKKENFRVKGRNIKEEKSIIKDLNAVENSGAFSVVIESVTEKIANKLCKLSQIKTIGIGASINCDGQILVTEDLLGFFNKIPKFVKKYGNFKKKFTDSVKKYSIDVINKKFPTKKNIY